MSPRFKVGDEVWVAAAGNQLRYRPCRICAGQKRVTLILGSGETVSIDCGFCQKGYQDPTGEEEYYEYVAGPRLHHVSGIEVVTRGDVEEVTYRDGTDNCWTSIAADKCFPTCADAMARSAELAAEHEAEQEANMARKQKDTRSYAWNAGYHLRQAKQARKDAEYHERKAVIMRSLSPKTAHAGVEG